MKACTRCLKEQPTTAYYKRSVSSGGGRSLICKGCMKAAAKQQSHAGSKGRNTARKDMKHHVLPAPFME